MGESATEMIDGRARAQNSDDGKNAKSVILIERDGIKKMKIA